MAVSNPHQIRVQGNDFIVRFVTPTTRSGAEACVSFCYAAARQQNLVCPRRNDIAGISASINCECTAHFHKRPPFSLLQGTSGWLRIHLLQPQKEFNVLYCLSTAFKDDGTPERFDLLEAYFTNNVHLGSCPIPEKSVESLFEKQSQKVREEAFAHWKDYRHSPVTLGFSNGGMRSSTIEPSTWQNRKQVRETQLRLSALRRELASLRLNKTVDGNCEDESSHKPSSENLLHEKLAEQSKLRETLLNLEMREHELEKRRSLLGKENFFDCITCSLLTLRWSIAVQPLQRRTHSS